MANIRKTLPFSIVTEQYNERGALITHKSRWDEMLGKKYNDMGGMRRRRHWTRGRES